MSTHSKLYWIHTITALHVGAGRGVGFIDLPIIREKLTGWPIVPGSTVKGVWRDYFDACSADKKLCELHGVAFGKGTNDVDDHAGSLVVTDARIALLPVRSFYGTFAWVTSPLALTRLERDIRTVGLENIPFIPSVPEAGHAYVSANSLLERNGRVYFEDLDFVAEKANEADNWADYLSKLVFVGDTTFQAMFKQRFVIISDSSFDFLCESGTEVAARVRIEDDKKVVADGALWYEESLPSETILSGIVWCDRSFGAADVTPDAIMQALCNKPISCQIGGKASVGKGQVRCLFTGKGA